jgi:hypothetical protein
MHIVVLKRSSMKGERMKLLSTLLSWHFINHTFDPKFEVDSKGKTSSINTNAVSLPFLK